MKAPPSAADPTASLRRIRWAQVTIFSVVVLALLATAAQSLIGAQRSAQTLTIGQGRRLLEAVQRAHLQHGPQITEHADGILDRNREFGLRCIGLFRREYVRRVGDCVLSEAEMRQVLLGAKPGQAMQAGDHIVMVDDPAPGGPRPGRPPPGAPGRESIGMEGGSPPPPGRDGRFHEPPPHPADAAGPPHERRPHDQRGPHERGAHDRRGPGKRGPHDRHGPPAPPILIEFQPVEAEALQASVATGAVVAILAVGALLFGTFALLRLSRRAEQLQNEAERDRRFVTLGEMASVLAHEIKNPLAALKGHAQLLAEQLPEDGRERRSANRVVRSAVRLEALTEDLLSLVRSNRVDAHEVSPETLLRESLSQVDYDGFRVDVSAAPSRWRLDPGRMQQVLVNLLQNAADASPEGLPPQVTSFEADDALVFRVRDHGPGIPTGEEDRIFEPFFTKKTQGTGLGLAVARRIVELHGGTIEGRNLASGGAEFEVVIP